MPRSAPNLGGIHAGIGAEGDEDAQILVERVDRLAEIEGGGGIARTGIGADEGERLAGGEVAMAAVVVQGFVEATARAEASAAPVLAEVDGDAQQPSTGRGAVAEGRPRLPGAQYGLLRGILRVREIDERAGDAQHRPHARRDQCDEGKVVVTTLERGNEATLHALRGEGGRQTIGVSALLHRREPSNGGD